MRSRFILAATVALALAGTTAASAAPMDWSAPLSISAGHVISGVSCPTTSLCVAVDDAGNILTSTDPSAKSASTWTSRTSSVSSLSDISCASPTLCVAVDSNGDVVTSTNPTGASAAWTAAHVDGPAVNGPFMAGVSCPAPNLCVAVDSAGTVATSSNPTGGSAAWTTAVADPSPILAVDIECPSTTLCVGADEANNVFTSTNPTGGAAAWTVTSLDATGNSPFFGRVSCPSVSFCATADDNQSVVTTTNATGGAAAWQRTPLTAPGLGNMDCASPTLCIVLGLGINGGILGSTNPTGGAATWSTVSNVEPAGELDQVECPSNALCVASDRQGAVLFGTPSPAAPPVVDTDGDGVPDASDACPTVAAATANGCPAISTPPAGTGSAPTPTAPGVQSQPASDKTAPTATLSAKGVQKLTRTLSLKITCTSEACTASTAGSIRVPKAGSTKAKTLKLKSVRTTIKRGGSVTVTLKLSSTARGAIKRALSRGRATNAKITVTIADAAGNTRALRKTIRFKR